jgi:CHAT domain-containing protein
MTVLAVAALAVLVAGSGPHASPESPRDQAQRLLAAGRPEAARAALRALLEGSPPETERAALLLVLAHAEVNLGRYEPALEAARAALAIHTRLDDRAGQAHAHARIAAASDELGRYDESHRHNRRALELYRVLGDRVGEARALSLFGTSYRFLGDGRLALGFHERARDIFAAEGRRRELCFELRSIGLVLEELGRVGEAEGSYRRALDLFEKQDGPWAHSDSLFHLGRLFARSGRAAAAEPLLLRALRLARDAGNRWAEARTLVELARIEGERDDPRQAADLARTGAELLRGMGARDLEWEALAVAGSLLERGGDLAGAVAAFGEALEVLEPIRSSIGPSLLRARYTPRAQGLYESLVRLQARWPRELDPAARARLTFETAERNRARTFAEMLLEAASAGGTEAAPLTGQERELRARMSALRTRAIELPAPVAAREALEHELAEVEREYEIARASRERDDGRRARIGIGEAVDLDGAARVVVERTDVLAYLLGDETSFGWYLDRSGPTMFEIPPRAEIENLVLLHRGLLLARSDPAARQRVEELLAERLLGPVARALDSGRELVVVPDGALWHLPFETLPVPGGGGRLLVERRAVGYAPSLGVLERLRRRAARREAGQTTILVAFGVPQGPASFPPLRHAGTEARRVAALVPRSRRVERIGDAATESELRALAARPSRIVHVSTHGVLDDARPGRSGLVFAAEDGGDGFLDLYEVLDLRIPTELVVLSGCETARGELLRGEGVLGLARAFLFAGSGSVVASLWRVDDRSTEELMVEFYRALGHRSSVAEALRQAKLRMLAATGTARTDPFSWAGFVLVGDGAARIELPALPRVVLGRVLVAAGAAIALAALLVGLRRPRAASS